MADKNNAAQTRHAIDNLFYSVATELTTSVGARYATRENPMPPAAPSTNAVSPTGAVTGATLRVDRGHVFHVEGGGNGRMPSVSRTESSRAEPSTVPVHPAKRSRTEGPPRSPELEAMVEQFRQKMIDLGNEISEQLSQSNAIYQRFEQACRLFYQFRKAMSRTLVDAELRENATVIESGR